MYNTLIHILNKKKKLHHKAYFSVKINIIRQTLITNSLVLQSPHKKW